MGEKIFFPNSAQFDEMNKHLSSIAGVLGSRMDVSTWAGIQAAVRAGAAPTLLPIGTQFKINRNVFDTQEEVVFDVVAHDHFKSAHDANARTMTLMCHRSVRSIEFDAPEAFYYAENELPAGTYNFTLASAYSSWSAGTYQFTLTKALPKGGQLCIDGDASEAMTSRQVETLVARDGKVAIETTAIISGGAGTSLGTFGRELNHAHRVSYGSNNYKESGIRQFINGTSSPGSWWTPQTKFDRAYNWVTGAPSFGYGLDEEFLAVIGEVIVPCSANNIYESPDSTTAKGEKYTVTDKFYLASATEIFGENPNGVADGSLLIPYYEGVNAADRIKYNKNGAAVHWWLRSSRSTDAALSFRGSGEGNLALSPASTTQAVVPVCTIV